MTKGAQRKTGGGLESQLIRAYVPAIRIALPSSNSTVLDTRGDLATSVRSAA